MARFKFGNKLLPNRDVNFGDDSFSVAESGGELHVGDFTAAAITATALTPYALVS